jgi:hypothetical protein
MFYIFLIILYIIRKYVQLSIKLFQDVFLDFGDQRSFPINIVVSDRQHGV